MPRHFKPFEFQGVPASYSALARARGLSCSTVRWRMKHKGMTLDEALAKPARWGKIAALARSLGLKPSTVKARMRHKKMTLEQALAFKSTLSPRGPNTITQRALAAGMRVCTVHRRVTKGGMTLDEAVTRPIDQRRVRKAKRACLPHADMIGNDPPEQAAAQ